MSEITHLTIKVEKRIKDLFSKLCKEEGVDISQGMRELLTEALARGYIVKERKERRQKISGQKISGGANA